MKGKGDFMTEAAAKALANLRTTSNFEWYLIPLLLIIIYIYHNEARQKNWSSIFAGLALWGCDWFNEIWNALVFHFTQYAPVWGTPGKSAYIILIGLNIEITMMFLLMGLACSIILPQDKTIRRSSASPTAGSSSFCSRRSPLSSRSFLTISAP